MRVLRILLVVAMWLVAGAHAQSESPIAGMSPPQELGPGTVLITGANRGLGLEFARQYAARGWAVVATARNPAEATELRELAASTGRVTIEQLEVLDLDAITALAGRYEGKPIDLLTLENSSQPINFDGSVLPW